MKIGILTFHCAHNYGAILQCYALQEYLKLNGHEVFIINYRPEYLTRNYKLFRKDRFLSKNPIKLAQKTIHELKIFYARKQRYEKFECFITKHFNLLNINKILESNLDLIIVGSDQVWNTHLTHGFDDYFWGNFKKSSHTKLISYAASIGEIWDKTEKEIVKSLWKNFDCISIREIDTVNLLQKEIPDIKFNAGVDPTLLIGQKNWEKIAQKPHIDSPYLLYYQVRISQKGLDIAKKIAHQKGLRLICLSASVSSKNSKECHNTSPEEFLGWFKFASFVVCTSFHGTIFSIIFEKDFISIKLNDGKDLRVLSLLRLFHLEEFFIEDLSRPLPNFIQYHQNITKLKQEVVKSSKIYLQKSII